MGYTRWLVVPAMMLLLLAEMPLKIQAACLPGALPVDNTKYAIQMRYGEWLGASVSATLMATLLRDRYGYPINMTQTPEDNMLALYNGVPVDIDPEVWESQLLLYVPAINSPNMGYLGDNGLVGQIGWYFPEYLLEANPDFRNWLSLRIQSNVDLFSANYNGDLDDYVQPQVLAYELAEYLLSDSDNNNIISLNLSDPLTNSTIAELLQLLNTLIVNDDNYTNMVDPHNIGIINSPCEASGYGASDLMIIDGLGLNFELKIICGGVDNTEAKLVEAMQEKYNQHLPFLSYYWEPNVIFDNRSGYSLTRMQLLDWTASCQLNTTVNCWYPVDYLQKMLSQNLANKAPIAFNFLKRFKYPSNEDQISIMGDITYDNMTLEDAVCKWILANLDSINNLYPYKIENIYLSYDLPGVILLVILTGLSGLLTLGIFIFINCHRNHPVVLAASKRFCNAILVGGFLGHACVFMFLGFPTITYCVMRPLLLSLSFAVMYSALLLKTFRIWRIFSNPFAKSNRYLADRNLVIFYGFAIGIQAVLLSIWFAVDIPKPSSVETSTMWIYSCVSSNSTTNSAFTWLLFGINCGLLFLGCLLAFETRKVSTRFRESRFIGLTIYIIIGTGLVVLPFLIIPNPSSPYSQQYALPYGILVSAASTIYFLFCPKIMYILFPHTAPDYDSTGEGSTNNNHNNHNNHNSNTTHTQRSHQGGKGSFFTPPHLHPTPSREFSQINPRNSMDGHKNSHQYDVSGGESDLKVSHDTEMMESKEFAYEGNI